MIASKLRPASAQAVSRKVEGIEPRNQYNRKDDAVNSAEVNTCTTVKARDVQASSWSETMACVTLRLRGNPGDPAATPLARSYLVIRPVTMATTPETTVTTSAQPVPLRRPLFPKPFVGLRRKARCASAKHTHESARQ